MILQDKIDERLEREEMLAAAAFQAQMAQQQPPQHQLPPGPSATDLALDAQVHFSSSVRWNSWSLRGLGEGPLKGLDFIEKRYK